MEQNETRNKKKLMMMGFLCTLMDIKKLNSNGLKCFPSALKWWPHESVDEGEHIFSSSSTDSQYYILTVLVCPIVLLVLT